MSHSEVLVFCSYSSHLMLVSCFILCSFALHSFQIPTSCHCMFSCHCDCPPLTNVYHLSQPSPPPCVFSLRAHPSLCQLVCVPSESVHCDPVFLMMLMFFDSAFWPCSFDLSDFFDCLPVYWPLPALKHILTFQQVVRFSLPPCVLFLVVESVLAALCEMGLRGVGVGG